MKKNYRYPVPDPACPTCGQEVPYKERKRCRKCLSWCHGLCVQDVRRKPVCYPCAGFAPDSIKSTPENVRHMVYEDMREGFDLDTVDSADILASLHIVCASVYLCGPDEGKICEITGLNAEYVRIRGDRLRASGIWDEDSICGEFNSKPAAFGIELLLFAMCAEGQIIRRST